MSDVALQVLEGVELVDGRLNVDDATILEHIRASIRRGLPQIGSSPLQTDRIALVCSGPSLAETEQELRDLIFAGAKVVTVNGAYAWCIERNIMPSMQIVMDARASNARFLSPDLPRCVYLLASQCHPDTFDAVAGRRSVRIFHAVANDEAPAKALLDAYYLGRWCPIGGGTTVGTRALAVLRTLGYLRFDTFGFDSCWLDGQHHACPQAENDRDKRIRFTVHPTGHPELGRTFQCAPWHIQQFQDVLQFIRFNQQHFLLNIHGSGLLAYALQANAELVTQEQEM